MMPDKRFRTTTAAAAAAILALLVVLAGYGLRSATEGPAAGKARESAQDGPRASLAEPDPDAQPLTYDVEYPGIGYSTTAPSDRVADLMRRLESGEARLALGEERGWLDSLLRELDIAPDSQVLVFSATSLQTGSIRASSPRAIYFNDDTYVAWVQGGGPIEIASMDPKLGPVFYTLTQAEGADFERQTGRCLRCHDSVSLSGGGVPRFIVGSGYIGTRGNIVAHEGWILTSSRTPLRSRWGGWYVTGRHGDQVHLGNIVVRNVADLQEIDELRIGNIDDLDGLVDTSPYASGGSDIVALLVLQHQIDVQNEIARVNFELRGGGDGSSAAADVAGVVEPLVEAMLCVGEVGLTD
ncbi:MAG: hypothetical protein JXB36_21075, partial [Gammaproteobacteria bacterium]|nr:hypothetical protein [Gammaproteobacteria bacterium]